MLDSNPFQTQQNFTPIFTQNDTISGILSGLVGENDA